MELLIGPHKLAVCAALGFILLQTQQTNIRGHLCFTLELDNAATAATN